MSNNGPKSSQDPNQPPLRDSNEPYKNEPMDKPTSNESTSWPHMNKEKSNQSHPQSQPAEQPRTSSQESTTGGSSMQKDKEWDRERNYQQKPEFERTEEKVKTGFERMGEKAKISSETMGDKIKSGFKNVKDSRQVDDLYHYAVSNKEKTITYTLLILGLLIIMFFSNNALGGIIIGLVSGYYFSEEIVNFARHIPRFFEGQDQLRYIVLGALALALLIQVPGIIVGGIVAAAFKYVMGGAERREQGNGGESKMNRSNNRNENRGSDRKQ